MGLGELGVANQRQKILVGAREQPDERAVIECAGLTGVARGLGLDPVEAAVASWGGMATFCSSR